MDTVITIITITTSIIRTNATTWPTSSNGAGGTMNISIFFLIAAAIILFQRTAVASCDHGINSRL